MARVLDLQQHVCWHCFPFCCPKNTWIGKVKYLVVSMKTQRFIFSATKFTFLSPFFLTPSNQSSWFGNFSSDSTIIGRKGECFFAKLLPYRDQLQFFQFMSNFLNFINLINLINLSPQVLFYEQLIVEKIVNFSCWA